MYLYNVYKYNILIEYSYLKYIIYNIYIIYILYIYIYIHDIYYSI